MFGNFGLALDVSASKLSSGEFVQNDLINANVKDKSYRLKFTIETENKVQHSPNFLVFFNFNIIFFEN